MTHLKKFALYASIFSAIFGLGNFMIACDRYLYDLQHREQPQPVKIHRPVR